MIQVPGIYQWIHFKKCLILPDNAFQTKGLIQSNYFSSNIGYALKKI